MAKRDSNGNGKVSIAAWNASLDDINARFEKIEKGNVNGKSVSVAAWDKAISELNARFDAIEKQIQAVNQKMDTRVSVKAWENSINDLDKQFNNLALKELKELDDRLDKTMDLLNGLTTHLNEKVNLSAWDRLCSSNEQLLSKVDILSTSNSDVTKRLMLVENLIHEAKVSEQELKKLLESI